MNILVTGGAGRIGSVVAAQLMAHGHTVSIIDNVEESAIKPEMAERITGATYAPVDIRDYAAVQPHLAGIEGVVHLAAIPSPRPGQDAEIFDINVTGTFNVYQAAAEAGVKRVISASSINALGNHYGIRWVDIEYFPVDAAHPRYTSDVYSYSKQLVEETADYFWRRYGISGVAMRFPFVFDRSWFPVERSTQRLENSRKAYDLLMALPEAERLARVRAILDQYLEVRLKMYRGEATWQDMGAFFESTPGSALISGQDDFWAIVDVRDVAQAIEKSLLADYEGSHALFIADSHNATGLPSRDLAALCYPHVKDWRRSVEGTETLVDISKARELFGYEPEHSVSALWPTATG
jgi:nucleoside-diphosphate-sugar epimerase